MKLHDHGVFLVNGVPQTTAPAGMTEAEAKKGTIAYGILKAHNTSDSMQDLRMKFDSMTSHDITYVGIIQTARASGMKEFQVRRHLCPAEYGRHPQLQPGNDVRLRPHDPRL